MPVSMSFPLPFSMYGAIEDALRLSWAVRKKPLESFLLPAAAFALPGGAGVLACRDGSLVSLFRLDGARSMMGARELDGFVELGARRLNSVFTAPGHALHAVFERAPDEAERLVAAVPGLHRLPGLDTDTLNGNILQDSGVNAERFRGILGAGQ